MIDENKQFLLAKIRLFDGIVDSFADELKGEFEDTWEDRDVRDKQEWVKARLFEAIAVRNYSYHLQTFDKFIERIYKHVYHQLLSKMPMARHHQECFHPDKTQRERVGGW